MAPVIAAAPAARNDRGATIDATRIARIRHTHETIVRTNFSWHAAGRLIAANWQFMGGSIGMHVGWTVAFGEAAHRRCNRVIDPADGRSGTATPRLATESFPRQGLHDDLLPLATQAAAAIPARRQQRAGELT
jgi:hypothetical protein